MLPWILIVLVLVAGVGAIVFLRRRGASSDSDIPLPDIDDPIDYTAIPEDEPKPGIGERFANMPLPAKIALFAAPVVLIGLVIIIVVVSSIDFSAIGSGANESDEPPPPPPSMTITKADLVSASSIRIEAETNLPEGTEIQVDLLAGGESFDWYDPETAVAAVERGEIELRMNKAADAPRATQGITYAVSLRGQGPDGQEVAARQELEIPDTFENEFFGGGTAASEPEPTPTPEEAEPEPTPTPEEAEPEPTPTPDIPEILPGEQPTEEPTPTPEPPGGMVVTVAYGGNVRASPGGEPVIDLVDVGEAVNLIEKAADGVWYRIETPRDEEGWIHYTLLTPGELNAVAEQVPVEGTTEQPADSPPEDSEEEGPDEPEPAPETPTDEPVADDDETDMESETGAESPPDPPPPPTDLTVTVFNGGNVRPSPGGEPVLDQVHANETVEVLEKIATEEWFHIRNERDNVGWVHYTLLNQEELDQVTAQVPVRNEE